jgi:hypothetical protein
MKALRLSIPGLSCAFAAHADFSHTTTREGGPLSKDSIPAGYVKK